MVPMTVDSMVVRLDLLSVMHMAGSKDLTKATLTVLLTVDAMVVPLVGWTADEWEYLMVD